MQPALLQRLNGWGASLSVLRSCAAHCIKLVCMAVVPEGCLFQRSTRKPANSLLKTSRLRTWITGTMSYGLMRPRYTYLVQMVSSVWRQPGEEYKDKCVLSTVKHGGGSVMVWGCMSAAGTGSNSSLKEPWMPTCTVIYWSRAWSPPFGDWAAGQYSNMIMTTALLKKLRVKVNNLPSMSPDLNPIEHLWGILKWKVEVSNIHQLRDDVMKEWKRTPVATCEALVNSMPKRVKAVLENNGGHTKYWHFGPNL